MLPPNLSSRRVFIAGENFLFEEGLSHLLTTKADVQVSREKYTDDRRILECLVQYQPDIILLAESEVLSASHLLKILYPLQFLASLSVIVVRIESNLVDMYDFPVQPDGKKGCRQYQFNISKPDDLVTLVQGASDNIAKSFFYYSYVVLNGSDLGG